MASVAVKATRLTTFNVPPTVVLHGSAGQFDLMLALMAKKPVNNQLYVDLCFALIQSGAPTDI